jgi:uncharacterized protein YnzC (UPF0291/DUF896 family)
MENGNQAKINIVNDIWNKFKVTPITVWERDKLGVTLSLYLKGYRSIGQVMRCIKNIKQIK